MSDHKNAGLSIDKPKEGKSDSWEVDKNPSRTTAFSRSGCTICTYKLHGCLSHGGFPKMTLQSLSIPG